MMVEKIGGLVEAGIQIRDTIGLHLVDFKGLDPVALPMPGHLNTARLG